MNKEININKSLLYKEIGCNHNLPQFVKYMGSKTKLLDFIVGGINEVYPGGGVCDLFAGACTLAGALGDQVPVWSNDIQHYSATLAKAYVLDWNNISQSITADSILKEAEEYRKRLKFTRFCGHLIERKRFIFHWG
jgi:adenine-specific DNA-methyltransferase